MIQDKWFRKHGFTELIGLFRHDDDRKFAMDYGGYIAGYL